MLLIYCRRIMVTEKAVSWFSGKRLSVVFLWKSPNSFHFLFTFHAYCVRSMVNQMRKPRRGYFDIMNDHLRFTQPNPLACGNHFISGVKFLQQYSGFLFKYSYYYFASCFFIRWQNVYCHLAGLEKSPKTGLASWVCNLCGQRATCFVWFNALLLLSWIS